MGGVCSGGVTKKRDKSKVNVSDEKDTSGFSGKIKSMTSSVKKNKNNNSYPTYPEMGIFDKAPHNHLFDSTELGLSMPNDFKTSTPAHKTAQMSSFLGKAGTAGLEVLDTLGSSMSNLHSRGFATGTASRGNKISILSFEVANTIVKAANLLESLSQENIQFLKKEVLHSEGIRLLVSTDMKELLSLAAADKREEFDVFSREVIRFGDLCKDPQWHNLARYFSRLGSDLFFNHKQSPGEADNTMEELTTLAQHTSELYHELHALDRFEQDYRRKLDELESLNLPRRGESLAILHSELKHQRKLVRSLKKKSLWSKTLEEVVEKMVDVVTFIHEEISEAFGDKGSNSFDKESMKNPERLGEAGLALHYANIINQIDNIAARPTSLPPNTRDALYRGLPSTAKTALRTRLPVLNTKEQLTVPQIKAEMEKTLQWLVPVSTDTTKAHQGFGWVGEWANAGNDFRKKNTGNNNSIIRLQTLYHADKKKMDIYIIELVTLLHRLINLVRYRDNHGVKALPMRSPNRKGRIHGIQLSTEDRNLLEEVMRRKKLVPGISKSQEFSLAKEKKAKVWAFSKSTGSSPQRETGYPKANLLDVLDGLDSTF